MKYIPKKVLAFFGRNPHSRIKIKQLSRRLKIPSVDYAVFRDSVKELHREGKLFKYKGNLYGLPKKTADVIGTADIHPRGFAYVHTSDKKKIFVNADNLKNACHGDTVSLSILRRGHGDRHDEGRVNKIIKRGRNEFVSVYHKFHDYDLAIPEGIHCREDIILESLDDYSPKDGEYIMAEITEWGSRGHRHKGKISRIIGQRDHLEFDAILVANQYGLSENFTAETVEQVDKINFKLPVENERVDLRDTVLFTIDPEDAKDFDDAVSLERNMDGSWKLGVHIADVSHYVDYESPLDREALQRGTSVYFTSCVIPMLPEKLSNDLCSLKPDVDRLAMSVIMNLDNNANILHYKVTPSIIHSRKQFSYKDVQHVLDTGSGEFYSECRDMSRLAKMLKQRRYDKGSIDFDIPEPAFDLDEKGIPVDIKPKERLWSHHIVEEFMLLANQTVASYMRTRGSLLPFIYRVHETPNSDDVNDWYMTLHDIGIPVKNPGPPITPKKFQSSLENALGHEHSDYVKRLALRTMSKAHYSTKPKGHFGLAFEDYTHFTSPIRRYPDLMIHRILKQYLNKGQIDHEISSRLKYVAKQSTDAEIRSLEAEREYHKIKTMRFIQNAIGDVFEGTVSGVAHHGFWVELNGIFVEGFVHIRSMNYDIWEYNKRRHSLKGIRTGRIIKMADSVMIKVVRVNIEKIQADFELVDDKTF